MDVELHIEELGRRYGPMVFRRCRQLLRDEDDAMDACQDVFVRLIEHQGRLNGQYPSSLLYRIATNVCLNRISDRNRHPTTQDQEWLARIASAETPEGPADAHLRLGRLFGRQPASSRTIAVLHYLDVLTLEQVADAVGLSTSGVRKRLRKLREVLVEMER